MPVIQNCVRSLCDLLPFLRATAVPPGTAEARISYGNSVCLSVRHEPVRIQCQVR